MSGIGGIGPIIPPTSLRKADKDGSGGGSGGRYIPNRRKPSDSEQEEDQTELSEEALERVSHVRRMEAAPGDAGDNNARLHILAEINQFNENHQRTGSRLKASLRPIARGNKLVIEDPQEGVTIHPFGEIDVFQLSAAAVRAKLLTFDRASGAIFDGRV